jgi:hypothetical protein
MMDLTRGGNRAALRMKFVLYIPPKHPTAAFWFNPFRVEDAGGRRSVGCTYGYSYSTPSG